MQITVGRNMLLLLMLAQPAGEIMGMPLRGAMAPYGRGRDGGRGNGTGEGGGGGGPPPPAASG